MALPLLRVLCRSRAGQKPKAELLPGGTRSGEEMAGSPPSPDCQQLLATIVHELQQKYDLAPEK